MVAGHKWVYYAALNLYYQGLSFLRDSPSIGRLLYVAVTGRKRTLFQNAIIEKNTIKIINIYQSLATIVQ